MEETLHVFFVISFFLCIGIYAMGWSTTIQKTHLKLLSHNNPYKGLVEGDIYISVVRYLGVLFLVISISMTFVRFCFPWMPPVTK
jgi:hypothetical protein